MEEREAQIKQIYNDCWLIYKDYLESHDMTKYNKDVIEITEKHNGCRDVVNLLLWFAPIVNGLHEKYAKSVGKQIEL